MGYPGVKNAMGVHGAFNMVVIGNRHHIEIWDGLSDISKVLECTW